MPSQIIPQIPDTIPSARAMQCTANAECDDGIMCNGIETCESNTCVSHPLTDQSNVIYGSDNVQQQRLDFSAADTNPESNGCTFVVYIHGGGFTSGSKSTFTPHVQWISKVLGYHAATIDYRLYNETTDQNSYPEQVSDVVRSLNYLVDYYGAEKFILAGHSAGGTLAALAALSKNNSTPITVSYPDAEIVGLIATAGAFVGDLLSDLNQVLFNNWSDGYAEAQAINVAECADSFPTLLVAGAGDTLSPWESSIALNDLLVNSTTTIVSGDASTQCHNCVIKELFLDANYNPVEPIPPAIPFIETFLNDIKNSDTSVSCSDYNNPSGRTCHDGASLCIGCQSDSECNNDDLCDGSETCVNSVCQRSLTLDCNDQNADTVDSCDAISGCIHTPNPICSNPPGTNLIFVGEKTVSGFPSNCINYSGIDGARFLFQWNELEPIEDQYNWDAIYNNLLIREWIARRKKIILGVDVVEDATATGGFVPQWVFDAGVPVIEDVNAGTPKYPPYWNSIYKEKLHDFIRDFAQEFDNWEPLALVRANGSNNAFEPTLASDNESVLLDQFIAQGFDGYKPNGVFAQAYNDMVRVYLESFVRTPVNLTLHFQNESNCAVLGDAKNGTNPEICMANGPVPLSCTTSTDCDDGDSCSTDSCVSNACLNIRIGGCCNCEDQMHASIHQVAIANTGLLGRKLVITNNGLNYQPTMSNNLKGRSIFGSYFNQGQAQGIDVSTGWSSLIDSDSNVTPMLLAWEALGDPSNPDPHFHTASSASVVIVGNVYCDPELYGKTQADAETAIQWMKDNYPDRSAFQNNYCLGYCQADTECTDGNACNGTETCNLLNGNCVSGTAPACASNETCDPAQGCVCVPQGSSELNCKDNLDNDCDGTVDNFDLIDCGQGSGQDNCTTNQECNDSNPCTSDNCDLFQFTCVHTNITNGTSCADSTVCNGAETCQTGVCTSGTPPTVNDNNACTSDSCDPILGVQHTNVTNGTSCADSNVCNGAETCQTGTCTPGTPPTVNDNNACTSDSCDPILGVQHTNVTNGTSCADSTVCNGAETCQSGSCTAGTPPTVDDGNPCTSDSCDAALGVQHTNVTNGTSCADSNVCNGAETCQTGSCAAGTPLACDDNQFCNGGETCNTASGCQPGTNPCGSGSCDEINNQCLVGCNAQSDPNGFCNDSTVCNGSETCNLTSGVCEAGSTLNCDDNNTCTSDSCDPLNGCIHMPITNGTSCADSTICNGAETCQSGTCTAGTPPTVDDGNPCTSDSCDAVLGVQHNNVTDGTSCADSTVCNGSETCNTGVCVSGTSLDCDDANPCTADSCDSVDGCIHTAVSDGTSCADGDRCNGDETCNSGTCASGRAALDCDDSNPCTADSCDSMNGCVYTAVSDGTSCVDGDLCNGSEGCQAGVCTSGTPLDCDDGDVCNGGETCDSVNGCQAGTPLICDDALFCNGNETCDSQLGCTNGTFPCGNGSCDENVDQCLLGCTQQSDPDGFCNDSDACNGSETCNLISGLCESGNSLACDDNNSCTSDSCDSVNGCVRTPISDGTSCDDTDLCNGSETCQSGSCTSGDPLICSENVVCDPILGCQEPPALVSDGGSGSSDGSGSNSDSGDDDSSVSNPENSSNTNSGNNSSNSSNGGFFANSGGIVLLANAQGTTTQNPGILSLNQSLSSSEQNKKLLPGLFLSGFGENVLINERDIETSGTALIFMGNTQEVNPALTNPIHFGRSIKAENSLKKSTRQAPLRIEMVKTEIPSPATQMISNSTAKSDDWMGKIRKWIHDVIDSIRKLF